MTTAFVSGNQEEKTELNNRFEWNMKDVGKKHARANDTKWRKSKD